MKTKPWNKCQECGKFIPYDDFVKGKASHRIVTPESLVTYETYETLCKKHRGYHI
jgi:hypothetical protein